MFRLAQLSLVLVVLCQGAGAQEAVHNATQNSTQNSTVTFDGEQFVMRHTSNSPPNGRLMEFVRDKETLETWSKLVGYRYQPLPGIGNDPKKAAEAMAATAKAKYPDVVTRVLANDQKNEAIVDFVILSPDRKYIEYDLFRYAKSGDNRGLVSVQLAYRAKVVMPPAPWEDIVRYKNDLDNIRNARVSWLEKVLLFDIQQVDSLLAE